MVEQDSNRGTEPRPSRPDLPLSYGILGPTHGSGLLRWSWVAERMTRARNYWIGTVRPDGAPHVVPVWGIWLHGMFYFATDQSSRKGRNLRLNPQMVVHLESGDEVVILEGVAEEVTEPPVLRQFVDAYATKYQVQVDITEKAGRSNAIFVLRPQVAYAWLESDYPGGATRWEF